MGGARIDKLQGFIEKDPENPFPRYGLAMEYKRSGDLDRAIAVFRELLTMSPDYLPAYYHYGAALVAQGEEEAARRILEGGIRLSEEVDDTRTREELLTALQDIAQD